MKKKTVSFLIAASVLVFLAGCGGSKNNAAQTETDSQDYEEAEMDTGMDSDIADAENAGAENFGWLPEGVEKQKASTEANEELRRLIIDYYEIPDYELEDTRYYYNAVDLDGDGKNELFALVVGSYTSGSGGSSALWCEEQDGALTVRQAFTLVNPPVVVVDNEDGGYKDLVLERVSTSGELEYVRLTCTDGVYTNVSDGEAAGNLQDLQGVAILCNDLAEDLLTGNCLNLAQAEE